jgi:hypothetical protein
VARSHRSYRGGALGQHEARAKEPSLLQRAVRQVTSGNPIGKPR